MQYSFFFGLLGLSLFYFGNAHFERKATGVGQQSQQDTLSWVREIEQYKQRIDTQKEKFKTLEYDIFESAEGGKVQCYFQAGDTLKREVTYYGENGYKKAEVYLKNEKPIYVEEMEVNYKEPLYMKQPIALRDSVKQMFYFNANQQLILWTKDAIKVHPSQYLKKEWEVKEVYF